MVFSASIQSMQIVIIILKYEKSLKWDYSCEKKSWKVCKKDPSNPATNKYVVKWMTGGNIGYIVCVALLMHYWINGFILTGVFVLSETAVLLSVEGTYVSFDHIVRVCGDVSGQTKVTDLCHSALGQEDIPGCQISVDALEQTNVCFLNNQTCMLYMTNQ